MSNPSEDLREFAKISLERHEMMQAATRREAANNRDVEIKRTYVEMAPPKGFADPPQKRGRDNPQEVVEAGGISSGAFFSLYVIASGGGAGDTYLQCGSVTGGNGGSETITDEKVLDNTTGVGTNAGKILYMTASCTATVTDGVMLPGCLLNSASLSTGASVPSNHTFTTSSATGNIYVEIGRWTADNFYPSMPGNILASGCIGNFSLSRV